MHSSSKRSFLVPTKKRNEADRGIQADPQRITCTRVERARPFFASRQKQLGVISLEKPCTRVERARPTFAVRQKQRGVIP